MGRNSKYDTSVCDVVHDFALLGATDAEMAAALGIAESTFYEWQKRYPEFSEALKKGKAPADKSVATALYNKALGAEWVEEQPIKLKRVEYDNGKRVLEEERVETVLVTRRAPPDTTAIIFWLKNRRSADWHDAKRHEHTGKDGAPLNVGIIAGDD